MRDKILITGGSGRLGRYVVDELAGLCQVTVLDIKEPSFSSSGIGFVRVDLRNLAAIRAAVRGQDAIVHLGGIDDGTDVPDEVYFETNVQGTWNLLHCAEAEGIPKLVVASSSAAYGLGGERMPDFLPVTEAHPQRPRATYSLTKQLIEVVCRSYAERGRLRVVCLRPTLIVRPEREAAILSQLALDEPDEAPPAGLVPNGGVEPYGALSVTRTYVRSRDCARCFRLALDYAGEAFDVFNVAATDSIGREPTLERLSIYGALPEVRDPQRYARDPFASVIDSTRARERLGWEPEGDWSDVVRAHRVRLS